jgi:exonuclease VII large subunit
MLQAQQTLQARWSDYIETLKKHWQEWFNYRKQFYDDIKRKYYEWVDKQKEAIERITRAEEEMRSRMAEAYESAARLAANLAARAGVYHVRFGAFGYFAIPVVQEAHPLAYTPSREEMTLSYTAYIYYYAQQIWLSIQNIIVLLQQAVGHLSLIAQAVAKSAGGATLNVNVPFGYDQIRAAIADAVNEALGKQLAHELVRNA